MSERKQMHSRNRHSGAYNFELLTSAFPLLKKFILINEKKEPTIDFYDPRSVRALNSAILKAYYGISYWKIPFESLCPPIPGRVDYIHHLADFPLPAGGNGTSKSCHCLDVGVGANCIYPILGCREYGWTFVGADISEESLRCAHKIVTCNPVLAHKIELRLQPNPNNKFENIIRPNEYFDFTLCNPPFYDEAEQEQYRALVSSYREDKKQPFNFGGVSNELWCEGGELRFIKDMIVESRRYARQVGWFTSYVFRELSLPSLYAEMEHIGVAEHLTIKMSQGRKETRFIAWRF